MTSGPDGVLFSRDHLWVRITDGTARVGLTDFAQETLCSCQPAGPIVLDM